MKALIYAPAPFPPLFESNSQSFIIILGKGVSPNILKADS